MTEYETIPAPDDLEEEEDYEEQEAENHILEGFEFNPDRCAVLKTATETLPELIAGSLHVRGNYCAVGWLMHCAGVPDDLLNDMDGLDCDTEYSIFADYLGVDYGLIAQTYCDNDRAMFSRDELARQNYRAIADAIGCEDHAAE